MALVGTCLDCGSGELHARGRCTPCYWKAKREAAKTTCPGCGRSRILRPEAGRCGMCVRRARPRKQPTPRICARCGRLAEHDGLGLCSRCYQRDPGRIPTWTTGALRRLGTAVPPWFAPLAEDLGTRCAPAVAAEHLRKVERLLHQGVFDPAAVIAALRVPGRSPGASARLVDEFFTRTYLGSHLDEMHRRAEQRRTRRLDRLPDSLRPAVMAFTDYLIRSRTRAALVGAAGLADATIEARIADLAVLGEHLTSRGITDWAAVGGEDVETFVTANTGSRLASCRAFFAFARRRKLILVNPTGGITHNSPRGFAGRVLSPDQQRQLLRRWMRLDLDPRERLVGLLSLIHGARVEEQRHLHITDVDLTAGTITLGRRPYPVPLDPLTAEALRAVLTARETAWTSNPHLLITKDSRAHQNPCSTYFMTHILDSAGAGVRPALLRQTRLADLTHQLDPRLVAAAFGMTEGGALHYITDAVDDEEHAFRPHL
jgi:site-specific recombinase XerD